MRHNVDGRKFGRNTSHRRALFKNLANAVISQEQIVTTVQKAKEARRVVDRLITLGKSGTLHSRRLAFDRCRDQDVVKKLFSTLAERYKTRAGGYTRILKLSDRRRGDAAEMAILELVDHPQLDRKKKVKPEAEQAQDAGSATPSVTDPFSKFRKLFKKKGAPSTEGGGSKSASSAAAKGSKKSAARRPSKMGSSGT